MRIRLTKHALSRMKEYDILESEVLTAITTESLALQSREEVREFLQRNPQISKHFQNFLLWSKKRCTP